MPGKPFSTFIKRSSGSNWTDLSIPVGLEFGMADRGPGGWRWSSSVCYETDKNFVLLPVCTGSLYCKYEKEETFYDVSTRDLYNLGSIPNRILREVKNGNFGSLTPLSVDSTVQSEIAGLDGTIKLILKPTTRITMTDGSGTVRYFLYESVDIGSLKNSFLPAGKVKAGPLKRSKHLLRAKGNRPALADDQIFQLFLLGLIVVQVNINKVDLLGNPGKTVGADPTSKSRRICFSANTNYGPIDPIVVFDKLNADNNLDDPDGYLQSPAVPAFFYWDEQQNFQDKRRDLSNSISVANFINTLARNHTYPYSILKLCKQKLNLTSASWDLVRVHQKQVYKLRLDAIRSSAAREREVKTFINWEDRFNPFQMEALVESFCKERAGFPASANTIPVTVDFRQNEPVTRSSLYLVQIDPMYDLGGPRTNAKIFSTYGASIVPTIPQWDEYEGSMFVIIKGEIRGIFYTFSSFTSSNNWGEALSSIEGNLEYRFKSRKSPGKKSHNYAFAVTRSDNIGNINFIPSWYYWGDYGHSASTPAAGDQDQNHKGKIVIHKGNRINSSTKWNGSHGCQVAPWKTYYALRTLIIKLWMRAYGWDSVLARIRESKKDESEWLFVKTNNHVEYEKEHLDLANTETVEKAREITDYVGEMREALMEAGEIVPKDFWNGKIRGTYFLIRPFEKQIGSRRLIQRPT